MSAGLPPFRDPRYAPRALEVDRRPDGVLVLRNPRPFSTAWTRPFQALAHWAREAPDRVWLSEGHGGDLRAVTYSEGAEQARALASALLGLGIEPGRSVLILARNGVDHALVTYGAMAVGIAAAPVSPQYGLPGADLGRLARAVERLRPAAVFVDDARVFGAALDLPGLADLTVIAARHPRPGDLTVEALLQSAPAPQSAMDAVRPGDAAKHLLTSGSTGRPRR
jgi:feruloyl-CoA synthase